MHAHQHDSSHPTLGAKKRLLGTLAITASIMLAEVAGGWWSGSLALLADAGHMLTDLLALVVAYGALRLSERPADDRRTYGYRRFEVLAALLNSVALVGVSGSIAYEALERWMSPRPVEAGTMIAVAVVGLVANLLGLALLRHGHDNLNMRGAFLHILGDTLSSVGVVAGGVVISLTGFTRIDPLLSVGIALIIVVSSLSLLREVVDVLLEAAPRGIDTDRVRQTIGAVAGVGQVHDLHIWSITAGLPALSAHVVLRTPAEDGQRILRDIQSALRERFAIEHATLQIETHQADDCGCA
ncbi:MAG TPA: cation diffusion facilitator family transporter [Myxococcota bacterium]|nr:cation diffusion facilitator family transporter [Myxococcota bacterium]